MLHASARIIPAEAFLLRARATSRKKKVSQTIRKGFTSLFVVLVWLTTKEIDMNDHLNALNVRLSNERGHLAKAKTEGERQLRAVWIAQIEKEIAREQEFIADLEAALEMTDEELLAELRIAD